MAHVKEGYSGPQFQLMLPEDCWVSVTTFSEFSQTVLNSDFYEESSFKTINIYFKKCLKYCSVFQTKHFCRLDLTQSIPVLNL